MLGHLQTLLGFYFRPLDSVARVLDEGRLGWAVGIAFVIAMLLQGPASMLEQRKLAKFYSSAGITQSADEDSEPPQLPPHQTAAHWLPTASGSFRELILVGLLLTPLAIALLGWWEGLGQSRGLMTRNFASVLACLATAWSAAKLPAIPLEFLQLSLAQDPPWAPWIIPATWLLFVIFAGFVFRTSLGAHWPAAFGTSALGMVAMIVASPLTAGLGNLTYMFASPWVLYMLYANFGGQASALGDALRGSQNYRRSLEAISLNPHDADAQYQLGLIELQRRNFAKAEERFRAANKIDPTDADYLYNLGLVLKETGNVAEAHTLLERAAQLNEKTSNNEVLRELGSAQMEVGHIEQSLETLERYTTLRPYDPAGLVYYGQALRKANKEADANTAFEKALEAWNTLPKWRAAELRRWERAARAELKK